MGILKSSKNFLGKLEDWFVVYELCWFFFCLVQFFSAKAGNIANSEGDPMLALKYVLDIQYIFWWLCFAIFITEIFLCFYNWKKEFVDKLIYVLVFRTLTFLMLFFLPLDYCGN